METVISSAGFLKMQLSSNPCVALYTSVFPTGPSFLLPILVVSLYLRFCCLCWRLDTSQERESERQPGTSTFCHFPERISYVRQFITDSFIRVVWIHSHRASTSSIRLSCGHYDFVSLSFEQDYSWAEKEYKQGILE